MGISEPFEQTVNFPSTEGPTVKTGQVVSEKTFKNYTILNMYKAQRQGQIIPG